MKKLFLLALAAIAFVACNDDKEDNGLPAGYHYVTGNPYIVNGLLNGQNMHFFGTSTTTDPKGGVFVDDKAYFEFAGNDKMTIYMHTTRFAAEMPAVRMRIPTIEYTGSGNSVAFEVASIVPEAFVAATGAYTPMPRYLITGLKGSIDGIRCKASFTCMGFKAEYEGQLIDNK